MIHIALLNELVRMWDAQVHAALAGEVDALAAKLQAGGKLVVTVTEAASPEVV